MALSAFYTCGRAALTLLWDRVYPTKLTHIYFGESKYVSCCEVHYYNSRFCHTIFASMNIASLLNNGNIWTQIAVMKTHFIFL